jgi:hypothetical protein
MEYYKMDDPPTDEEISEEDFVTKSMLKDFDGTLLGANWDMALKPFLNMMDNYLQKVPCTNTTKKCTSSGRKSTGRFSNKMNYFFEEGYKAVSCLLQEISHRAAAQFA